MAKINVTTQQLMDAYREILSWNQGSMLKHFLSSKIKEFENHNMIRIHAVSDRLKELGRISYQHEMVKGQPVYKYEGEGNDRKILYNEGETEATFKEAYEKIMNEITVMEV